MENNKVGPITAAVDAIKKIARNVLRGKLIASRLAKIGGLEADLKAQDERVKFAKDGVAANQKQVARSEFAKSKIDAADPDREDLIKEADADIESAKKSVALAETHLASVEADVKTTKEEITKAIAEQNEGIAKIESGETKVSKEDLAELVDKLLVEQGREAVRNL